ncbi:putative odorant receptor 98b [Drosophila busckii]|uniref:putative odorant receptor 98b n=1 Tax=Drosophila busckii TaxID=30019 RepID=UPI00083F21D4|nr:putative odorant receptor 98b [Drosophila busckii]
MLTNKFLKLQSCLFRLLGFELLAKSCSCSWQQPHRTFASLLAVLSFLPLTVCFGLRHIQNLNNLTDALCSLLIDVLAVFKLGLLICRHKDIMQLLHSLQQLLHEECRQGAAAAIIAQQNKREQFISGLYKNIFIVSAASACLMPLLRMLYIFYRYGQVEPALPFPSVYPWHNRHLLNYSVSYAWNVCAAAAVLLPTVCVDTLYCALTHNLCALFQIAQHKFKHATVADYNAQRGVGQLDLLTLYQRTLDLTGTLNACFRLLVTVQFLIASLHLCVLSYQMATNLLQPDVLFFFAFTCSILAQVYLYCYCGECVKDESMRITAAIYECSWLEMTCQLPGLSQTLQLSMLRAQRASCIRGYFLEANRITFVKIVKTAMSYVTLLRSMS